MLTDQVMKRICGTLMQRLGNVVPSSGTQSLFRNGAQVAGDPKANSAPDGFSFGDLRCCVPLRVVSVPVWKPLNVCISCSTKSVHKCVVVRQDMAEGKF